MLKVTLNLFLCMVSESVLASLIYMQLSIKYLNTTCWRYCLFSIVYSCLLYQRLIDHRFVDLFLGFSFCSVDPYVSFCVNFTLFWLWYLCNIWSLEGCEVPRWLSGKRICLPIQEMQKSLVQSMGREDTHGEGNSNPLQYSCLENPINRRGCWGQKELDVTEHSQSSHVSGRVMPPTLLFFLRIALVILDLLVPCKF